MGSLLFNPLTYSVIVSPSFVYFWERSFSSVKIGWTIQDGTERYDFWLRFLFCYFIFPFSSLPKKRGKREGEWSSKNRDEKSYLSVPSNWRPVERQIF